MFPTNPLSDINSLYTVNNAAFNAVFNFSDRNAKRRSYIREANKCLDL